MHETTTYTCYRGWHLRVWSRSADERGPWSAENYEYGLGPYRNGAGEIDFWRRELSLNDLGRSFMVVDDFAMRPSLQLTPKP